MPNHIKALLTLIVAVVGAGSAYLEVELLQQPTVAYVIIGLAAVMILALWLFPEAAAKKSKK